jgi:hypothetical protein
LGALPAAPAGGRVWLPPVADARVEERDEWIARAAAAGRDLVVQVFPGQQAPSVGCAVWIDPLAAVVEHRLEGLGDFPAAATLLWPLVAGITTDVARFARLCETVREAGGRAVVPLALRLAAVERRLLARGREEAYERLFHAPPPVERDYVRLAESHALEGWFTRSPNPRSTARQQRLEAAATILGEIAELRVRMDDGAGRAAAFLRAMREVEAGERDLEGLWREGNLSVLPWCDGEIAAVLGEAFARGRSQLREQLWSRYVGTA